VTNKVRIAGIAFVIFFLAFATDAQEFHKQLPVAEKQHILDGPFTVVMKTEDMPASVKQVFTKITGEPAFALANPGRKFRLTDVNPDLTLPPRRLVFAGTRGDEWFVHYELGGFAHSYCVVLFSVDSKNSPQFLWGGSGFHAAKNMDELRKMIAHGEFADDKQNYW